MYLREALRFNKGGKIYRTTPWEIVLNHKEISEAYKLVGQTELQNLEGGLMYTSSKSRFRKAFITSN